MSAAFPQHLHMSLRVAAGDPQALLNVDQAVAAASLLATIDGLRAARECATSGSASEVVYGRIDGLISEHQDQLLDIYRQARGAQLDEVNTRG